MRLWELEEGDEGHGQVRFEGPRRWEAEARAVAEAADREEAERLQQDEDAAAQQEAIPNLDGAMLGNDPEWLEDPVVIEPALIVGMAGLHVQPQQQRQDLFPPALPAQRTRGAQRRRRRGLGRPNGEERPARGINPQLQPQPPPPVQQVDPAQAAAFRRFLAMAERDEEDGWDSDELDDDEMWEIRAR